MRGAKLHSSQLTSRHEQYCGDRRRCARYSVAVTQAKRPCASHPPSRPILRTRSSIARIDRPCRVAIAMIGTSPASSSRSAASSECVHSRPTLGGSAALRRSRAAAASSALTASSNARRTLGACRIDPAGNRCVDRGSRPATRAQRIRWVSDFGITRPPNTPRPVCGLLTRGPTATRRAAVLWPTERH